MYLKKESQRIVYALGSIIAITAVILQLWLTLNAREISVLYTIIRFFSYFTILTNSLVAVYFTSLWIFPHTNAGQFFKKFSTTTAIAVYILVVGIIYNLLLRNIWVVTGWGKVADELLHSFIPLYFLMYWFFFTERKRLVWKDALNWLLYPMGYFIYSLIRGTITNTYPYPFIDVNKLGYQQTLINCLGVGLLFYGLCLSFIAISRKI